MMGAASGPGGGCGRRRDGLPGYGYGHRVRYTGDPIRCHDHYGSAAMMPVTPVTRTARLCPGPRASESNLKQPARLSRSGGRYVTSKIKNGPRHPTGTQTSQL
eukprot:750549-Hanusia_phi.AAC.6